MDLEWRGWCEWEWVGNEILSDWASRHGQRRPVMAVPRWLWTWWLCTKRGEGEGGNVWECTMMTESGDMGTRGGRRRRDERGEKQQRDEKMDAYVCVWLVIRWLKMIDFCDKCRWEKNESDAGFLELYTQVCFVRYVQRNGYAIWMYHSRCSRWCCVAWLGRP